MHATTTTPPTYDLELIAQRILKLAEIASLEHLESLMNSQAQRMLEQLNEPELH